MIQSDYEPVHFTEETQPQIPAGAEPLLRLSKAVEEGRLPGGTKGIAKLPVISHMRELLARVGVAATNVTHEVVDSVTAMNSSGPAQQAKRIGWDGGRFQANKTTWY